MGSIGAGGAWSTPAPASVACSWAAGTAARPAGAGLGARAGSPTGRDHDAVARPARGQQPAVRPAWAGEPARPRPRSTRGCRSRGPSRAGRQLDGDHPVRPGHARGDDLLAEPGDPALEVGGGPGPLAVAGGRQDHVGLARRVGEEGVDGDHEPDAVEAPAGQVPVGKSDSGSAPSRIRAWSRPSAAAASMPAGVQPARRPAATRPTRRWYQSRPASSDTRPGSRPGARPRSSAPRTLPRRRAGRNRTPGRPRRTDAAAATAAPRTRPARAGRAPRRSTRAVRSPWARAAGQQRHGRPTTRPRPRRPPHRSGPGRRPAAPGPQRPPRPAGTGAVAAAYARHPAAPRGQLDDRDRGRRPPPGAAAGTGRAAPLSGRARAG